MSCSPRFRKYCDTTVASSYVLHITQFTSRPVHSLRELRVRFLAVSVKMPLFHLGHRSSAPMRHHRACLRGYSFFGASFPRLE